MAKKSDLMGLGLNFNLARVLATEPSTMSVVGSSQASAAQIGGDQYLVSITATATGNYANLPNVGGASGCYLGDDFLINNQTAGSVVITASAGVNFSVGGASTVGTTGVSIATHTATAFYPITATSWLGLKGS